VIHRDIKPSNIMLSRDGRIKIMDFSIAHIEMGLHESASIPGSPMYTAPEQLDADREPQPQADIYSLGAVMYTLLSRRPLFRARTIEELNEKIRHQQPDPLSLIRPDLPDSVIAIIEKCLHKNPEHRYPDAGALASDLQQAFSELDQLGQQIELQGKCAVLRHLDFFHSFSDRQIGEIAQFCQCIELSPGEAVVTADDNIPFFYVVARGRIELIRDQNRASLGPGDCFGEIREHTGAPARFIAATEALIIAMTPDRLEKTRPGTQLAFYRQFNISLLQRFACAPAIETCTTEP